MEKKLIALVLSVVTVLPLAACGATADDEAEIAPEPVMNITDLNTLAAYEDQFPNKTPEESAEIWAWAHQVVEEWYVRYQALVEQAKNEKKPEGYSKDDSEYSRTILVARNYQKVINGQGTKRASRTLSTVKGWADSNWSKTSYERTVYGGFIDEANRQEATGFFYVKKIDGRWFYIDPLGYPTIMTGVQGVTPSFSNNTTQEAWVMSEFGSQEKWAIATTAKLKKDHGVYGSAFSMDFGDLLYDVPDGFVNVSKGGPGITSYCKELGIAWDAGSTYFDPNISQLSKLGNEGKAQCNMVMPVFNRGFIEYLDRAGQTQLAPYANENRIVAWSCANEIPIKTDMLDRYLKYTDPEYMLKAYPNNPKIEYYYETYAVTITWMRFMTGKDSLNQKDITDELRTIFLSFIYDHMLYHCRKAYEKYVPNHLFLGVRWLSNGEAIVQDESNTIMARPWLARVAGNYSDVIAINWYVRYYAESSTYEEFSMWTQGKPVFLTEFNAWTEEGTGYYMPDKNSQGCVATQEDRAAFFEHITLEWMEWDTVVGWSWYRYNHYTINNNTQSSTSGIVQDTGEYDIPLQESMGKINSQAYNIARYLHERHTK